MINKQEGKKIHRARVGDVFRIPLPNGKFAYAKFIHDDPKMGPLVCIFDTITDFPAGIEAIKDRRTLFPPIIMGLKQALKEGNWQFIAREPVSDFVQPLFINGIADANNHVGFWYLWDGEKDIPIGPNLPEKYKALEWCVVWSYALLEDRIVTGANPMSNIKL